MTLTELAELGADLRAAVDFQADIARKTLDLNREWLAEMAEDHPFRDKIAAMTGHHERWLAEYDAGSVPEFNPVDGEPWAI